jgi:AraC-like DNA-binding protein
MTVSVSMEQLQTFSDALNQRYGSYTLQPVRDHGKAVGSLKDRSLDTVTICMVDVESVISRRQKLASHLQDHTFILAPLSGEMIVDQYDRISRLTPGNVLILDSLAGCSIAVEDRCSALTIELNRSAFDRFGGASREICARKLDVSKCAGGIYSSILGSVAANMDACLPQDGELIADLVVSLVGRVAREGGAGEGSQRSAAILRQMRDWVRSNLNDPELSPERLAKQFGFSRRGVYRQFAALGTTPSKWLWDIRLECADERLQLLHGSVSEIAYSVGFNDSSHFSRLYKRRYGRPPTMRHKRA